MESVGTVVQCPACLYAFFLPPPTSPFHLPQVFTSTLFPFYFIYLFIHLFIYLFIYFVYYYYYYYYYYLLFMPFTSFVSLSTFTFSLTFILFSVAFFLFISFCFYFVFNLPYFPAYNARVIYTKRI